MNIDNPLISVVIPCYNVEKFLDDCFKSLINQSYKNIEIIFVDDGSKDKTPSILDDFKCDYKCTIIHQKNAGVSAARNAGLKKANGFFVYFLDPDDIIHPDTFKYCVDLYNKNPSDLISFKYKIIQENTHYKDLDFFDLKKRKIKNKYIDNIDILLSSYVLEKGVTLGVCHKLFLHKIIKNMKTYPNVFNSNYSLGDDIKFVADYLVYCNNGLLINEKFYFYKIRKNSVLRSKYNDKQINVLTCLDSIENVSVNSLIKTKKSINVRKSIFCILLLLRMKNDNNIPHKLIADIYKKFKLYSKGIFKYVLKLPWYDKYLYLSIKPILRLFLIGKLK